MTDEPPLPAAPDKCIVLRPKTKTMRSGASKEYTITKEMLGKGFWVKFG